MKIFFRRIEIHNFMSFADEVFDFEAQTGMNLVCGKNLDIPSSKNGAGKSNVFAALLWGLYGQLSDSPKAENIANRCISEKDVRVVVYLNVDDVEYKAATSLNKHAQGAFSLAKIEEGKEIDITKSSIAETRKYFEDEILHCDVTLFLRTILLTSTQNYNFFKLKKQGKKEFIEKLFDIELFGEMYAKIHKDVLLAEKQIAISQNSLVQLTNSNEDYKARINAFNQKQQDDRVVLEKKLIEATDQLISLQKNEVSRNDELIKKYEDAQKKLFDVKYKASESLATTKVAMQRISSEIVSNKRICDDRAKIINKHSKLLGKLCNDCKKVFDQYHNLSTYRKEAERAELQNDELKKELSQKTEQYSSMKTRIDEIDIKISKAASKLQELNSAADIAKSKHSQAQQLVSQLKVKLEENASKTNPYNELAENTLKKIKQQSNMLDEQERSYLYLKKAEEIVSQDSLKKFIIKDLIGIINNRIRTYLSKMGARYTCVFDENLDFKFVTDTGSCELQNFSCGEQKRLEIAACLSFRDFIAQRSNISSNILILDEYIDSGIDSLAVESILQILKEFTIVNRQNIFIISHRSEINNDVFDRIIELQKKDGISTIHYPS